MVGIGLLVTVGATTEVIAAGSIIGYTPGVPVAEPVAESPATPSNAMTLLLVVLTAGAIVVMYRARIWRLPRVPRYDGLSPLAAMALLMVLLLAGVWGVMLAARVFGFSAEDGVSVRRLAQQSLGIYGLTLPVCLVFFGLLPRRTDPADGTRFSLQAAMVTGLVTVLVAWPVVMGVGAVLAWIDRLVRNAAPPILAHDTLRLLTENPLDVWAIVLMILIVVGAGLVEEVTYRGLIQGTLRKLGMRPWMAMTLSTMIFVGMHIEVVEPHALGSLFALSLAFGWAYERTGRLAAPIVMHMAFNAGNLLMAMA